MYNANQGADFNSPNSWMNQVEFRFTPTRTAFQLAVVNLHIGALVMKGFRVLLCKDQNRGKYWVSPPTLILGRNKKSIRMVSVEDDDLWKELEQKIILEYCKQYETQSTDVDNSALIEVDNFYAPPTEEINVDNIIFN